MFKNVEELRDLIKLGKTNIDEFGNEYWYARELQNVLGYH